jgi:SAM-dependent methyltransferase
VLTDSHLSYLRTLSSSPYDPEPPRQNLFVNLIYRLAKLLGRTSYTSPHLFSGSNADKVQWEYNEGAASTEALAAYGVSDFSGLDVLDVGCGWGGKMIYLAEHCDLKSISGFDLPGVFDVKAAEAFASRKGVSNCHFTTGYAESIPFAENSGDLLIMEDVMEHVADPEKVMAECFRVLRPGGRVVIKFPSIDMAEAHHLDRAISLPGIHYLMPLKTWAAGLNHLLLKADGPKFEPFDEVVATKFNPAITRNLNGLTFGDFTEIAKRSGFQIVTLELRPRPFRRSAPRAVYALIYETGLLHEFLSSFIVFVGEKPTAVQ